MNESELTYLSNKTCAGLLRALRTNEGLRLQIGIKLCPFTGQVEEYTMVEQLGGKLDVWPAKWRGVIESGRVEIAA